MSLFAVLPVVLLVGLAGFLVTLTLGTRRVVATGYQMQQAMDRMNLITIAAGVVGIGVGLWAWVALG